METTELKKILSLHKLWARGKENGTRADLRGADLRGADLDESETPRLGQILQDPIIGYKKCRNDTIVTLEILKGAIVFSINNSQRQSIIKEG